MDLPLNELLPLLPARLAGEMLTQAVHRGALGETRAIVAHLQHATDLNQRSMGPVRTAFDVAASQGQWDVCQLIKPLADHSNLPWMRTQCWEYAARRKDASLLEHLDALDLRQGALPVHPLFETAHKPLLEYILRERTGELPTLEKSNRACGHALEAMASCGAQMLQDYLHYLHHTRLPADLLKSKLEGVASEAWEVAMTKRNADSVITLAEAGLWPRQLRLAHLFHSDMGPRLCANEAAHERLSRALLDLDPYEMDSLEDEALDKLLHAGLPVWQWRDGQGRNIAHVLLGEHDATKQAQATSWILLRQPSLLCTPDQSGAMPLEKLRGKDTEQLVDTLRAMIQSQELDHATQTPSSRGRGARF